MLCVSQKHCWRKGLVVSTDKKGKTESVSWKELRSRLVTPRGKELMEKIIDHMKYSPTKVWLILGEGKVFIIKDATRGYTLHCSYTEKVFKFRDHRNQEQEIHEDEISDVSGF